MRFLFFTASLLALLLPAGAHAQRVDQLPSAQRSSGFWSPSPAPSLSSSMPAVTTPVANGIVAVVNDDVISQSDLTARLKLAVLSAGMPDTPDIRKKLLPQVLRALIDEQLQLQEGKKSGVTISHDDIKKALARIAEDNKIPGGNILAFLEANGVPPATLRDQVKAALTWNTLIMRDVRPRVDVGDDEIEGVIQRLRSNEGKDEYAVSEIFLAVDKPEEEESARTLVEKLVEQLREGASFAALARQFSQGLGATNGGDLGWIQHGQLAAELDRLLPTLQSGEVSDPVRSASGYHILALKEKRTISLSKAKDTTVKLQQAFRPFTPTTAKEELLQEAATIKNAIEGCDNLEGRLKNDYPLWRWQDLGEVKMDTAPAWLVDLVARIPAGHASDAMATDKGALMVFVCERAAPDNINREAIRVSLGSEKMELLARRKLRDLRREAYIDIRLK